MKDDDVVRYLPSNTDAGNYVRLPDARAGHSMNLIGNPPYFILIYGGFSYTSETKTSTNTTIYVRENYDDLWVFSLYSKKWQQVAVNSDSNPSIREDSVMITVSLERLAIMYGGFYAENVYSEMWYFNLFSNMWQKLNQVVDTTESNSKLPPGLQGHTFVYSDIGLILYGGQTWLEADIDITDTDFERKSVYEANCLLIITDQGFTIDDIGTAAFAAAYDTTNDTCFLETEPFLQIERSIYYNTDIYLFPINK